MRQQRPRATRGLVLWGGSWCRVEDWLWDFGAILRVRIGGCLDVILVWVHGWEVVLLVELFVGVFRDVEVWIVVFRCDGPRQYDSGSESISINGITGHARYGHDGWWDGVDCVRPSNRG